MSYKHQEPFITPKYPIEVPTDEYYSSNCVFKLKLGTKEKFYIGKCQSLPQAMTVLATQIERAIRTRVNDQSGWYYHVIAYIINNRVMRATVERITSTDDAEVREEPWELLKAEQILLDKNKNNPKCLNNNFEVYIPKWIDATQLQKFKKWQHDTNKANSNKHRAGNARKKHTGGQVAVRSVRRISAGVRSKASAKKGTGGKKASPRKKSK